DMNTVYGLNEKIGNMTFYDSQGQSDYNFTKPYSEKTAELIDFEISDLIESQYERALEILEEHKAELTELAELLLEREVIFKEDLEKIFGEPPYEKADTSLGINEDVEDVEDAEDVESTEVESSENEEKENLIDSKDQDKS